MHEAGPFRPKRFRLHLRDMDDDRDAAGTFAMVLRAKVNLARVACDREVALRAAMEEAPDGLPTSAKAHAARSV